MHNRRLSGLVVVATLVFVVAAWLDLTPLLRGPDEWRWLVRLAALPGGRIIIPIAILALYTFVCGRWLHAFDGSREPAPAAERGFLAFLIVSVPRSNSACRLQSGAILCLNSTRRRPAAHST